MPQAFLVCEIAFCDLILKAFYCVFSGSFSISSGLGDVTLLAKPLAGWKKKSLRLVADVFNGDSHPFFQKTSSGSSRCIKYGKKLAHQLSNPTHFDFYCNLVFFSIFIKFSGALSFMSSIEKKPSATSNCPRVSSNSKFLTKFSVFSLNSDCLLSESS